MIVKSSNNFHSDHRNGKEKEQPHISSLFLSLSSSLSEPIVFMSLQHSHFFSLFLQDGAERLYINQRAPTDFINIWRPVTPSCSSASVRRHRRAPGVAEKQWSVEQQEQPLNIRGTL